MRILLLTPVFGRPEITKIWAKNVWIKDVLAVLSPEDKHIEANKKIIFDFERCSAVLYKNNPLGEKMNEAVKWAYHNADFDYLMNLDSDGILHKGILDLYKPLFDAGSQFFGPDKVYFIDYKTKKIRISKPNFWCSGRVISRKIIEKLLKMGENLYYNEDNRGLDARSVEKVERLTLERFEHVKTNDIPYILDIKTWHSLNDFNFIQNLSEDCDQDIIRRYFPKKVIRSIYG